MDRLAQLVTHLEGVLAERGSPAFVDRFEDTVEQIASIDDPASIEALLRFVDDTLDDDLAFSLVHAAERFDDRPYVKHLLAALPGLHARSREWARTLLIRVLNSAPTLAELRAQAPALPALPAAALRATLLGLVSADPEFADRAGTVLARLPH